jgi:hypothetical protein
MCNDLLKTIIQPQQQHGCLIFSEVLMHNCLWHPLTS